MPDKPWTVLNLVAGELGLMDKINTRGWGELTAREVGKIGGTMVKKMIEKVRG